ncbi:MAG: hypothetical protein WAS33_12190, partial [Candidatus Promineifilaceae bacterium]
KPVRFNQDLTGLRRRFSFQKLCPTKNLFKRYLNKPVRFNQDLTGLRRCFSFQKLCPTKNLVKQPTQ